MSLGFLRTLAALLVIVMPRSLTYVLLYPIFRLVFGNLYPAYASYKAVRTKNVKEYVKWMMYWIVFALFTCAETFTDVFFSFWFPFYYEIKTILVIWLLSPATKGSSILYRRFVHPALIQREAEIDEALARATEQGYTAVLHLGSKGVNYATTVLMQTAIKGGGGLVQHLKKSYSLSDLTGEKEDENRNTPHMHDETDMEVEPRRREHVGRRGYSPRRTQSSSNRVEMYFSEVDVDVRQPRSREPTTSLTNIRSSDDISSGYSSGEALQSSRTSQGDSLVRTSSVGARTRAKPRSATKKTPEDSGEDSDSIDPPSSKNISFPPPLNLVTPEQALEILLLLSQNRNVADYINFDRGPVVPGNDDLLKDTSQSGPELGRKESRESVDNPSDHSVPAAQLPMVEAAADPERSLTQSTTVTDELCENKFEELKQLLSDARRAANDIVHSQERSRLSDAGIVENADDKTARLEEETKGRAGKYNKRPAPKAPLAGDWNEEEDGRSALKATLVIKTGTLKSFSNAGTAKDVFVARSSKGSRSRREHAQS
ncbi:Receptor expression-enhancing protein [Apis cerana cerana]|uniref:Receptor expression-enhancing protein n=1 Tax=Apis cerana cerana TaxID=94128 RepID=A0A2A3E976_APICC|nr:Receptor expression-enhancing protein [Apis cerana cerana]